VPERDICVIVRPRAVEGRVLKIESDKKKTSVRHPT